MDAQPSYRQCAATALVLSCRQRRRCYCARWGLIGAIGFLAFLFSAVSPDDDDIQQESVQGNKQKQLVLANYKATRAVDTLGTSTFRPALVTQPPTLGHAVVGGVLSIDQSILGTIVSSRIGDRSPPSKSF